MSYAHKEQRDRGAALLKEYGIVRRKKTKRVSEADSLDEAYRSAAAFDEEQFRKWIKANMFLLCKRTDYPKLGYIIHRLNEEGIPCLLNGSSFHASHCLYVLNEFEDKAWKILDEKHGRYSLDEVRDDHPKFNEYADVKPDPITGDEERDY